MEKKLIFISHITEEKDIALKLKGIIEKSFLGMIDVFVSSDDKDLTMGSKWLGQISTALERASVEIVICSPYSITRPWINFEAGAGWVRNIPVIPLCHSGMKRSELPVPLNQLQAGEAKDINSIRGILSTISTSLGSSVPDIDLSIFLEEIEIFEYEYTFLSRASTVLSELNNIVPIVDQLKANKEADVFQVQLTDSEIMQIRALEKTMVELELLNIRSNARGAAHTTVQGTVRDMEIVKLSKFNDFVRNTESFNAIS
ncbi:toll/interleukin-1 receptor domain-containing protein [Listeria grandensis]|uniref:toll/interleukin-1 receptor domain-containing protein n=1 Tax=Listeria grandensis TaxID=1494963 RepID=UPI00164D86EE|nr:toll/interleukin-1 receptor domain-containing protein [Listeria grandensis]MBC6316746.1 toll/interleukin-1 receptor domain-containing protein [Listeria grandensis]